MFSQLQGEIRPNDGRREPKGGREHEGSSEGFGVRQPERQPLLAGGLARQRVIFRLSLPFGVPVCLASGWVGPPYVPVPLISSRAPTGER